MRQSTRDLKIKHFFFTSFQKCVLSPHQPPRRKCFRAEAVTRAPSQCEYLMLLSMVSSLQYADMQGSACWGTKTSLTQCWILRPRYPVTLKFRVCLFFLWLKNIFWARLCHSFWKRNIEILKRNKRVSFYLEVKCVFSHWVPTHYCEFYEQLDGLGP